MRRWCWRSARIRFSPTSTRSVPARRCRRSCSTCSRGIGSKGCCARPTSSVSSPSPTTSSTATRSTRTSIWTTTSCSSTSGSSSCWRAMSARPTWSSTCRRPPTLLLKRLREQARETEDGDALIPDATYLQELNEAYQHFFFHYTASPLLVVETSSFGGRPDRRHRRRPDPADRGDDGRDAVLRAARLSAQHEARAPGTRHAAPSTAPGTRHPARQLL